MVRIPLIYRPLSQTSSQLLQQRRALKRKQALELQQAATRGVELEVERWAAADRVRGKEMVTQEGFLTWHAKWTDGGAPTVPSLSAEQLARRESQLP